MISSILLSLNSTHRIMTAKCIFPVPLTTQLHPLSSCLKTSTLECLLITISCLVGTNPVSSSFPQPVFPTVAPSSVNCNSILPIPQDKNVGVLISQTPHPICRHMLSVLSLQQIHNRYFTETSLPWSRPPSSIIYVTAGLLPVLLFNLLSTQCDPFKTSVRTYHSSAETSPIASQFIHRSEGH